MKQPGEVLPGGPGLGRRLEAAAAAGWTGGQQLAGSFFQVSAVRTVKAAGSNARPVTQLNYAKRHPVPGGLVNLAALGSKQTGAATKAKALLAERLV